MRYKGTKRIKYNEPTALATPFYATRFSTTTNSRPIV